MAHPKIAIIIGSTRNPRVGLPISKLIHTHLLRTLPSSPSTPAPQLDLLDLADHLLPWLNEPGIPQYMTSPSSYTHAPTQAWSRLINSYSGFIFVTPQYNWGMPGALKNNMDFLYHEWTGKPAAIVSYGGRGGGKAAENLKTVCSGLRMDLCAEHVELRLGGVEGAMQAAGGEGRLVEGMDGVWEEEMGRLRGLVGEVVEKAWKVAGEMGGRGEWVRTKW